MPKRLITCTLCSLTFEAVPDQQEHFKSKFHRHNLRRKLCGLAAIKQDDFDKFLETAHSMKTESQQEAFFCQACAKHFSTENQLKNHLRSKRHREVIQQSPVQNGEADSNDSDASSNSAESSASSSKDDSIVDPVSVASRAQKCLLCDKVSRDCVLNIEHMYEAHGLFIPFLECVTSPEGLVCYLRDKMETLHQCLSCESQRFSSLDAVRKHMIDKRHLSVDPVRPNENGLIATDLFEFYDIPEITSSHGPFFDDDDEDEDEENCEEYEMCLPSGATIGHRSLNVYYRQRFNGQHVLCLAGGKQLDCPEKEKMLRRRVAEEQRAYRGLRELRKRYYVSLGVKANKLQRHFRPQVEF